MTSGSPRHLPRLALLSALAALYGCGGEVAPTAPRQGSPTFALNPGGTTWTVTTLSDFGDGSCTSNDCTLREAIAAAQWGDRIVFKKNLAGTIAPIASELRIDKALAIDGPGGGRIVIDAQANGRDFHITGQASVTLSGLTISGGGDAYCGGGILVDGYASLALVNSLVSGNAAVVGGGICSGAASVLALAGSTVAGNSATISGGGIYTTGAATLTNSTVSGNSAAEFGGGIFNLGGLWVRSSTVVRNTGTGGGGGIYNAGIASMINTINVANPALSSNSDCGGGSVTSLGHNLLVPSGGCVPNVPAGDVVVAGRFTVNAFFDPNLADNGGPTPTHALYETGFAVDAGICANGETTDQRGFPRPYDDLLKANAADGCDIGAFEWQPTTKKK